MLGILSQTQVDSLVTMVNNQGATVDEYGYKRFVLIKAFQRLLDNDVPSGSNGLDVDQVKNFTSDLYAIDAVISYNRAQVMGGIIADLNDTQKTALTDLHAEFVTLFNNTAWNSTWPTCNSVALSGLNNTDDQDLVGTYASQLISWFLGSVYADTYFSPDRHGTYFGAFYLKDIPTVVSTTPVSIDTELTKDVGTGLFDTLNDTQDAYITSILDLQRDSLGEIVDLRGNISVLLRQFINGIIIISPFLVLVRCYCLVQATPLQLESSN